MFLTGTFKQNVIDLQTKEMKLVFRIKVGVSIRAIWL